MQKKRFRLRYIFWLDLQKADERAVAEKVEILKTERAFASAIRDGIRLVCDLRAGHTEVLFELFPWVKDSLQTTATASTDQRLQEQIARLEALLIAQGNVPLQSTARAAISDPTSRVITQRTKATKVEVSASQSKASGETVAKNFLSSMASIASGFFD